VPQLLADGVFRIDTSDANGAVKADDSGGNARQKSGRKTECQRTPPDSAGFFILWPRSLASQLAGQDARSANLTLTQPGFYGSADPTETFTLWDFTGDVTALKGYGFTNPPNAADAVAIREDLRSGISYGSTVISQPAGGPLSSITITLDPMAIAAINSTLDSANLLFAIGGFSDTLTGQQLLFQSSGGGPNIARLDVVPVPIGGVGLPGMVMALGGIIALARRRRKAAA